MIISFDADFIGISGNVGANGVKPIQGNGKDKIDCANEDYLHNERYRSDRKFTVIGQLCPRHFSNIVDDNFIGSNAIKPSKPPFARSLSYFNIIISISKFS